MKARIFALMVCLVSGATAIAQTNKKTISQASTYKSNTVLTDTVFGQSGTSNAKWAVRDEVTAGDVTGTQGNTFVSALRNVPLSGVSPTTGQLMYFNGTNWGPLTPTKSTVGLGNVDNTSDVSKPVSTAQATAIAAKQNVLGFTPENSANKGAANGYAPLNSSSRVPIANIASGTPDGTKFIRDDGTLAVPAGTGGGGSSTSRGLAFSTVAYASSINLDFNSTTNYSITATGNISFTNSNITSGEDFEVKIIKNTSSNITLSFPSSSWTAPSINNNAVGMASVIQTAPPGYTLTGATGSVYSVYIHNQDLLPVITLNNTPNFYDPSPLATNIVVFDGRASYTDPGNTTSEVSVYHLAIPASIMKANSKATVKFWMKRGTSGSGNIQYKVRAGTSTTISSNSIVYDYGNSGSAQPGLSPAEGFFQNNNSTSSQLSATNYNAYPNNYPVTESSFSFSTSGIWYIDITIQKGTGTDTGAAGNIEVILSNI
jgi:hypothetical protein